MLVFSVFSFVPAVSNASDDLAVPLAGFASPKWYAAHRIHFHTRLSIPKRASIDSRVRAQDSKAVLLAQAFENAATKLHSMGVAVLTRHIKSGSESAPWLGGSDHNVFLETIRADAQRSNIKVVAYVWDSSDSDLARQNPDWLCRDRLGRPRSFKRGEFIDLLSPYGAIFAGWLKELNAMGFAGAYLDANHYPRGGCYGSFLETAFRAENEANWGSFRSANSAAQFRKFQAEQLAMIVSHWQKAIDDPEFALIVSVGTLPTLVNPQVSMDLARSGIPKTEFSTVRRDGPSLNIFRKGSPLAPSRPSNDIRFATGMSLLATVSGTFPHVWLHGFQNEGDLLRAVGSVITNAGVANIDLNEKLLAGLGTDGGAVEKNGITSTSLERITELDALASLAFKNMRLPRFAAIHFSSAARDDRSPHEAWVDVAGPVTIAFEKLSQAGLPVEVIDDRLLAEGDLSDYRFILSATAPSFTVSQVENIRASGAELIELPSVHLDPATFTRDYDALIAPLVDGSNDFPFRLRLIDSAVRGRLWVDPSREAFLVSAYRPAAIDILSGTTFEDSEPISLSHAGNSPTNAKIEVLFPAKLHTETVFCSHDILNRQDLGRFSGDITISGNQPWILVRISPCE